MNLKYLALMLSLLAGVLLTMCCLPTSLASDMQSKNYSAMGASTADISRDERNMTLAEARNYMLSLINKDRAGLKLPPVTLDEVASAAAQFHSDDMASKGYMDHYDLEGRSPD
ncbi:MAG: CAP domain-containing protein, partial [Candidatus Obscuribacterales bacterium]|nr:CAP domain-containing protein [Candidatus Obscuribacterales bacterium]